MSTQLGTAIPKPITALLSVGRRAKLYLAQKMPLLTPKKEAITAYLAAKTRTCGCLKGFEASCWGMICDTSRPGLAGYLTMNRRISAQLMDG